MRIGVLGNQYTGDAVTSPCVHAGVMNAQAACDEVVCNLEAPITERNQPIPKKGSVMRHHASTVQRIMAGLSGGSRRGGAY